jgi:hypothetical protein
MRAGAHARYPAPALLGIYAVSSLFIGILWLPFVRSVGRKWIDFFLSLTIGLLVFLGVEALLEAVETAALVPDAFQGMSRASRAAARRSPSRFARPVAFAARRDPLPLLRRRSSPSASGYNARRRARHRHVLRHRRIALGTFLVIGFLLTTPPRGWASWPRSRGAPRPRQAAPARCWPACPLVIGAWLGAFAYSPVWTTLFFAIGAGAIVQVVYEIWRLFARRTPAGLTSPSTPRGCWRGCSSCMRLDCW